ncbi:hypothetical protein EZV62_009031 [Acer yangbiense]|uniref:Uncharacterized protein n=1 Tax=Acer yangbiense TaxID=1000413 RepID=A0A5C7IH33_9ROSI|nr:hypothetical protein EZV62_009031 [Acer yangbiense]
MLKILRNRLISGEKLEAKIYSISKRLLRQIGLFEDQRLEQEQIRPTEPSASASGGSSQQAPSDPTVPPSSNMDMSHEMFSNGTEHLDLNNKGHPMWHEADTTPTYNEGYNPNDTCNNNEWPYHVPFANGNVSTAPGLSDDNLVQPADNLLHSELISLQVSDIMRKEFISVTRNIHMVWGSAPQGQKCSHC